MIDRLTLCYWCVYCAGNENLHLLASDTRQRLRVDLGDFEGNTAYAEYDDFEVNSVRDKYKLVSVGMYNETAGQYDMKLGWCV